MSIQRRTMMNRGNQKGSASRGVRASTARALIVLMRWLAGSALVLAGATVARAADVSIEAEYLPGAQTQGENGFRNITRPAGFCAADPGGCAGVTTVDLPVGDVSYGALDSGATGQDGVYLRAPANPIRVELRDERTNRVTAVTFRVVGMFGQYTLRPDVYQLTGTPAGSAETAHAALWNGGGWLQPPAGCTALSVQPMATANAYRFGWRLPRDGGGCFKTPRQPLPAGAVVLDGSSLAVAYELVAPDPVSLPNGTYQGVHTFTVGAGKDFDFGAHAHVARSSVDVAFVLKVRHKFMITDSGAGNDVKLAPAQGWLNWIAEGKPSTRIERDVAYGLSTGEPLRVSLRCEDGEDAAGRCVMRNAHGSVVPVDLALTVAGATTDRQAPFSRIPLTTRAPASLDVDRYLDSAVATAHVAIDGQGVSEMGRHPGTTYTGRASVVFDAIAE